MTHTQFNIINSVCVYLKCAVFNAVSVTKVTVTNSNIYNNYALVVSDYFWHILFYNYLTLTKLSSSLLSRCCSFWDSKDGGGICAVGSINTTLSKVTVTNNSALHDVSKDYSYLKKIIIFLT